MASFPYGGTYFTIIACALRRVDSTTWEIIDDANHVPLGVDSVEIVTVGSYKRLRLYYENEASQVVSLIVTPDEAFAAKSVRCGVSAGLEYADILMYYPAGTETPVDPGAMSTAGANLWICGLVEA